MNLNESNERIKKAFRQRMQNEGRCEATIRCMERAIYDFERFTNFADFQRFNADAVKEYKRYLNHKTFGEDRISVTTYCNYLRAIKRFFMWLSDKRGYRRSVTTDKVAFLNPTDKEMRTATQPSIRDYPQLSDIVQLANSIKVETEVDLRDRGLVSFCLISGMRAEATITTPLSCFDEMDLFVNQSPKEGVETKYSKIIGTRLMKIDGALFDHFMEWFHHLKKKGFGAKDPLFPRAKTNQGIANSSFEKSKEVEAVFWANPGQMRAMFNKRSSDAGLKYYQPHTFRHLAAYLAFRACKNGEEIKAVSQNFGHEFIATTLAIYGNLPRKRLCEVIGNLDFTFQKKSQEEKIDQLMEMVHELRRRENQSAGLSSQNTNC